MESRENVSRVVEKSAAQAVAHHRQSHGKPQFLIEDQQGQPAHRKAGLGITRAGLVQPESAQRVAASGEEALRQSNLTERGFADGLLDAEARRARKHQASADRRKGGVLGEQPDETRAGADGFVSEAEVGAVERAATGIGGIVAPLAEPRHAYSRDPRGLAE